MRAIVAAAALAVLSLPALAVGAEDPWALVERFRSNLVAESPFRARFTQSYRPEGFSSAEIESGEMMLSLPECLRWDYDDPFPKSFILCGDVFHYWNPGETEGHRDEIEAREQPGLDLLLLDVAELRARYSIDRESYSVDRESGLEEGVAIVLRPLEANEFVAEATLRLDASLSRLLELRYVDPQGNTTSFTITDYRPGIEPGTFNPPENMVWVEY